MGTETTIPGNYKAFKTKLDAIPDYKKASVLAILIATCNFEKKENQDIHFDQSNTGGNRRLYTKNEQDCIKATQRNSRKKIFGVYLVLLALLAVSIHFISKAKHIIIPLKTIEIGCGLVSFFSMVIILRIKNKIKNEAYNLESLINK